MEGNEKVGFALVLIVVAGMFVAAGWFGHATFYGEEVKVVERYEVVGTTTVSVMEEKTTCEDLGGDFYVYVPQVYYGGNVIWIGDNEKETKDIGREPKYTLTCTQPSKELWRYELYQ